MGSRAIPNYSMWSLFYNGCKTFVFPFVGEGATI